MFNDRTGQFPVLSFLSLPCRRVYVKRILISTWLFGITVALLAACATQKVQPTAGHPPLSEQEMLVACHDCHAQATPQVSREWHQSGHGIASVKCYQCHGTFEQLKAEPSLDSCAVCHSGQWAHAEGKKCWQCHSAHTFKARR
jgi:hypothetical protein